MDRIGLRRRGFRCASRMVALAMAWTRWHKRLLQGVIVPMIGAAAGLGPQGGATAAQLRPCALGGAAETGRVVTVLDGDSVRFEGGRVMKLAGVEAPQPPLALPAGESWSPASAAKAALERLVDGREVAMTLAATEPDRYGRWRVNLFAGGEWVQERLVAAGWARVHWYPSDSACVFSLLKQEAAARATNLGLWRNASYGVLDALDASLGRRNGLYELVQGRIRSVGHGDYMTFLDFGDDYRRDFTIMVSPKVVERFEQAGVSVDGLKGHKVRVRGVIEESGGPAIRLGDPGEIEVLDDGSN